MEPLGLGPPHVPQPKERVSLSLTSSLSEWCSESACGKKPLRSCRGMSRWTVFDLC